MRTLLIGLLLLAATGCSSLSTSFDYDTTADFAGLRTYSWIEDRGGAESASLALKRVRTAVDRVLAERGYRLDSQAPDFLVAAHVTNQERVQVTDWGYSYGRYGSWYGRRDLDVYTYDEGSLVLDVVDSASRSLVWRGTASRAVDPDWTPEKREQVVNEAVEALLQRFPPSADG
jgi:hypothetical protein